jgi:hypothetical protein
MAFGHWHATAGLKALNQLPNALATSFKSSGIATLVLVQSGPDHHSRV